MLVLTPLGHSTVLMELGDFRIITDPVLGDKVGVSVGPFVIGSKRLQPPAMRAEELPPVDLILLSHSHFDHTDRPTLRKLPKQATAIVQRGNRDLVWRFRDRRALAWWQSTTLHHRGQPFVEITSIPARHWGARALFDPWRGFGGFVLDFLTVPSPQDPGRPLSVCFAGDTAKTDAYQKVRQFRGGADIDVAIMPIGAYDPWIHNHCSPEEAWKMAIEDLGAQYLVPIHYDTFPISREPKGEPISRLKRIAQAADQVERLVSTAIGATFQLEGAT